MSRALRTLVSTLALVATLAAAGIVAAPAPATAATASAPIPVVRGNHLIDQRTGDEFRPMGVNQPGFEYLCRQGYGYMYGADDAAARALQRWHVTTVRIGLNQDCWLGLQGAPANVDGGSSSVAGYRNAVANWVETLNDHGIVAIITLGWSAPSGTQAFGQRPMPDANSVAMWASVAARFRNTPSVMFDVFGEPYSRYSGTVAEFDLTWTCWRDGGCLVPNATLDEPIDATTPRYVAAGMTQLVAAIRGAGAKQPIMLPGIDWANDLRGWVANKPADSQLVASWHGYADGRCSTTACWTREIAPVARVVPVVIAETGQIDGGSDRVAALGAWAASAGVGYLQWAWWQLVPADDLSPGRYEIFGDISGYRPKPGAGSALYGLLAAAEGAAVPRQSGSYNAGKIATVRYSGGLRKGDELTVVVPVRMTTGRSRVRVTITAVASGSNAVRQVSSTVATVSSIELPIAARLTATRTYSRVVVTVTAASQSRARYGVAQVVRVR